MKKCGIIVLVLSILLISGCHNQNEVVLPEKENIEPEISIPEDNDNNEDREVEVENNIIEDNTSNHVEINNDNNTITDNKVNEDKIDEDSKKNEVTYSSNDIKVINKVEDINKDVDSLLKEDANEDVKSKAKGIFISLVDFVFYDGEINGVTFEELTTSGKEKVLSIIHTIDEKIENKFPGYKESISKSTTNAFNKASELIKNGAYNIQNFAKEKLGDEYYQDIIDAKDELVYYTKNAFAIIGDISSNLFNNIKDKLSEWYENFKNQN